MNTENKIFRQFAKGNIKHSLKRMGANCVIYTRVSTKEQADNNQSLETQRKACEHLALKEGFKIGSYFGGTYESAQSDERREFKKMLDFVNKSREQIGYIIVYSVDRFSRSGANAIFIASELKKRGISILSVTQPTDTETASGSFYQNMSFIFSQFENDLRRQKCMAGVKEKLLKGEWATLAPLGYTNITRNGQKLVEINEQGKLLRKAFLWKANEGISNEEILQRLEERGLKMRSQTISSVLRNPFYCGLISHNMLEGELIEGVHEKLVSKEVFLKVNDLLKNNNQGYSHNKENNVVPLKQFLKCDNCGTFMRGYIVKRKKIWYYKCGTKGCCCNKSAKQLHSVFEKVLGAFTLNKEHIPLYRKVLIETFNEYNLDKEEDSGNMKKQRDEITQKMERLEERFINEEMDKPLFEKFYNKLKEERKALDQQMFEKSPFKKSNLEEFVDTSLEIICNLGLWWQDGDYETRQKLQYLMFPEGISYNKKNDECRTERINSLLFLLNNISEDYNEKEKGKPDNFIRLPLPVARRGVEPLLPE